MLASSAARWLPPEFVETSRTGGFFTLVAYALMLSAFVLEMSSFLSVSYTTAMMLDRHGSDRLQVNFDIDLYSLRCRNLHLAVFAQGSEERVSTQDFWLRPIDKRGFLGHAVKPGEPPGESEMEHLQSMDKFKKEDGESEVDSDWDSSHDGFKHDHFDHVIRAHDFTFVNFFLSRCSHCRDFAPKWAEIARKANGGNDTEPLQFLDHTKTARTVKMIKMNCEDFFELCVGLGIRMFPTMYLYKSDGTMVEYNGKRKQEDILSFFHARILADQGFTNEETEVGCNAKGRLEIPRVPGRLELMAGFGDQHLLPSLTNVSHLIKHLSFSDPEDGRYHRKSWASLPRDVSKYLSPLDGQAFLSDEIHQAWTHDLKIVSTVSVRGKIVYQVHHQKRLAKVSVDEIPQAKFHFDVEPFSVLIQQDNKQWYEFCTSVLAITGGCFTVLRLLSRISLSTLTTLRHAFKRTSSSVRGGGLDVGHFE